jgi:hypothetical protein
VVTPVLVLLLPVGYLVYRLSLTVRAVRADRAGDAERASQLRTRAFEVRVGTMMVLLVALAVFLVVAVAATH